jgi:hypothetical protein
MIDKFIAACCIFSFICGAYLVEMIEIHREHDKGCVIKFMQGKETHIHIGHTESE